MPLGFWYHFGGEQAMGEACVQAHIDYVKSWDPDILKIMCDSYFPVPCFFGGVWWGGICGILPGRGGPGVKGEPEREVRGSRRDDGSL